MISAERNVPHPPERVFDFFSDLRNDWRLEPRAFLELEDVDERNGLIRLKGPRAVLALGARAWLRHLFERALAYLESSL